MLHNTFSYKEYIFVTDCPNLLNSILQQAVTHKDKKFKLCAKYHVSLYTNVQELGSSTQILTSCIFNKFLLGRHVS